MLEYLLRLFFQNLKSISLHLQFEQYEQLLILDFAIHLLSFLPKNRILSNHFQVMNGIEFANNHNGDWSIVILDPKRFQLYIHHQIEESRLLSLLYSRCKYLQLIISFPLLSCRIQKPQSKME